MKIPFALSPSMISGQASLSEVEGRCPEYLTTLFQDRSSRA